MNSIAINLQSVSKKYQLIGEKRSLIRSLAIPYKRHKKIWALKNISLKVGRGESLGIIGKNGSGKSTLLKVIAGITSPTEGGVEVDGRVGSLIELGAGFQPDLTGRENVFLNGALLGFTKKELKKRYKEIVKFADIGHFIRQPVRTYSSGMEVRLGFAVASHLDPEVLLIDEALAVGDSAFQRKCIDKMNEFIKAEKNTIIYVSHNLMAVRALCKKVILLANGEISAAGRPEAVINKYAIVSKRSTFARNWSDKKNAPQNESAIITRVAIKNSSGKSIKKVNTDNSFIVEIEFETKMDGSYVGTTIVFYDSENNCILSSINNFEQNWYGKSMPRGRFRSHCVIPANFFNNGEISLSVNLFGANFSDSILLENVLKINILDGLGIRGDYFGEFGGNIRPKFFWQTKRI